MQDILKRIERLEQTSLHYKDGFIWVRALGDGKYLVLRPAYIDEPGHVSTVPEALYGQIIGENDFQKYAVVLIETEDGRLVFELANRS